jgi:hypothetical protein
VYAVEKMPFKETGLHEVSCDASGMTYFRYDTRAVGISFKRIHDWQFNVTYVYTWLFSKPYYDHFSFRDDSIVTFQLRKLPRQHKKYLLGDWSLFTLHGQLEGKFEGFCLWEKQRCNSSEGNRAVKVGKIFAFKDSRNASEGIVIGLFVVRLSSKKKKCMIVSYRFMNVKGNINTYRLEVLIEYVAAGYGRHFMNNNIHLPSMRITTTGDIFVAVVFMRRRSTAVIYQLSKTLGFKKELMRQLPGDVGYLQHLAFDYIENRVLIASEPDLTRRFSVSASPVACSGRWTPTEVILLSGRYHGAFVDADMNGNIVMSSKS